jgi:hypothetical protein
MQQHVSNLEIQNLNNKKSNFIFLTCVWIKNGKGTARAQETNAQRSVHAQNRDANFPACRNAGNFSYEFVL